MLEGAKAKLANVEKAVVGSSCVLVVVVVLLVLAVVLFLAGIQLFSVGLLAELVMRTYHESQQRPIYRVRTRVNFAPDLGEKP